MFQRTEGEQQERMVDKFHPPLERMKGKYEGTKGDYERTNGEILCEIYFLIFISRKHQE